MRFFAIAIVLFLLVLVPTMGLAQQTQHEETVTVPKSMLSPAQRQQIEIDSIKQRVEMYGKWVGIGHEIGEAVNGALHAVTTQTAEFAKTDVGRITMILVAWKVMGKDFVRMVIGLLLLGVGIPVWVWSYWKTCIPRRVLVKAGSDKKERQYEVVNNINKDAEKWGHAFVLGVFLAFCILVMFV